MKREQWQRVKEILDGAIPLDSAERTPYLDSACADDTALRQEVESLLAAHDQADTGFLKTPVATLASDLSAATPRAGRRIGAYQIIEQIGYGGMGEVYRAERADGQYTKQVAIKLVRSGLDTASVLERFRNERQILASLDHPNIARLLDGGTTDEGVPYLVMELVEGTPVDQFCDSHQLPISERLQLFRQICVAVQYAHQHLVIHRDLKPSNILVTHEGVPKLLDFGIAKILDPTMGDQGTLTQALTPDYASPEQIRGEPITTASDVYSLGIVLYQLLTGRSPYPAETRSSLDLARAICETPPRRPSSVVLKNSSSRSGGPDQPRTAAAVSLLRDGTPARLHRRLMGDLDNIVLMALRKEPQRRYASVEQFSEDIRRHLEGLPVTATKSSWRYRAGKFVVRHKAGVAASAIVLLILLAGIVATARSARIARQQAEIARVQRERAERRFNDVRKLANTLIFEIDNSIQNLPGSTPARKLIVQKSLEYLDSLATESAGDVSLQRELAYAYLQIGLIQGYAFLNNLGDSQAAITSLRKGLAIRENVARENPTNIEDRVAVSSAYRVTALVEWVSLGKTADALRDLEAAISNSEVAVAADPNNMKAVQELAADYFRLGDMQSSSGRQGLSESMLGLQNHRKALALFERVAASGPNEPSKQYPLAMANLALGTDLAMTGDPSAALPHLQRCRQVLEVGAKDPNNLLFRRGRAHCESEIGDAMLAIGRTQEAVSAYRLSLKLVEPLAAADPKDIDAQQRLSSARTCLGYALVIAGKRAEGQDLLQKSLTQMLVIAKTSPDAVERSGVAYAQTSLASAFELSGNLNSALPLYADALQEYSREFVADPQNVAAGVSAAMIRNKMAQIYLVRSSPVQADEQYQKALDVLEKRVSLVPTDFEALYALQETYSGMADLALFRARHGSQQLRLEHLLRAESLYQKSLSTRQRIPNPNRITPQGFLTTDPADIRRRLDDCKSEIKSSGRN